MRNAYTVTNNALRGLIQVIGLIRWLIVDLGKNLVFLLVRIRCGQGS
jgi:hypothetical protein